MILLASDSLHTQNPNSFCDAHYTAYKYYLDHLKRLPQYLWRYLPELLYHLTNLRSHDREVINFQEFVSKLLHDNYGEHGKIFIDDQQYALDELRTALQVDEELKRTAPDDYSWLISTLN